jgi:hypothetical protein
MKNFMAGAPVCAVAGDDSGAQDSKSYVRGEPQMPEPAPLRLVVDRLEGEFAVLTDGRRTVDVPLAWLPEGLAEGAHLTVRFGVDPESEATARTEVARRIARLSADDDGGDFAL